MIKKEESSLDIKKSKWQISADGWYPYCPNCGTEPKNGVLSNFCPECGQDMRNEAADPHIFVVTVFEKCESSEYGFAETGCTRSPCFRTTFAEAEEVVKLNMCDIWEHCYDYAVIHEIGAELYPYKHMRKFYKFNRQLNSYEPIEEPECLSHIDFCGIG